MEIKELWNKCLGEIELNISKANFSTWFKNTTIIKEDGGIIYLGVPNEFVKDWLYNKFHKLILKVLINNNNEIRGVEYVINKDFGKKNKEIKEELKQPISINKELPLNDFYIDKENNLNPRYGFNSFIVGPFNELAYAVSQAIIKTPGENYNPFFVYGGTGLGKTHMIQAIGNSIKEKFPSKKIYYVSLEKFAIDYINSIQNKNPNAFKEKYRKYDVFIMDDIQFISKMDKTQEELFHLFNTLYENNKQIIFSSDKSPKYIPNLEERLRSRFEGGMIVDVSKPDYESRLAILQNKVKANSIPVAKEILEYLASVIQDNIRELEGALKSISCQINSKGRELTLSEVKQMIKHSIKPKKTLSMKDVLSVVANYYNIEEKILYEKTRRKEVVKPRQIVMYILREDFNTSYPYIGQKLGGRDHTTVIHAYEKIKKDLKINSLLNQEVEQIRSLLYTS